MCVWAVITLLHCDGRHPSAPHVCKYLRTFLIIHQSTHSCRKGGGGGGSTHYVLHLVSPQSLQVTTGDNIRVLLFMIGCLCAAVPWLEVLKHSATF